VRKSMPWPSRSRKRVNSVDETLDSISISIVMGCNRHRIWNIQVLPSGIDPAEWFDWHEAGEPISAGHVVHGRQFREQARADPSPGGKLSIVSLWLLMQQLIGLWLISVFIRRICSARVMSAVFPTPWITCRWHCGSKSPTASRVLWSTSAFVTTRTKSSRSKWILRLKVSNGTNRLLTCPPRGGTRLS